MVEPAVPALTRWGCGASTDPRLALISPCTHQAVGLWSLNGSSAHTQLSAGTGEMGVAATLRSGRGTASEACLNCYSLPSANSAGFPSSESDMADMTWLASPTFSHFFPSPSSGPRQQAECLVPLPHTFSSPPLLQPSACLPSSGPSCPAECLGHPGSPSRTSPPGTDREMEEGL